MNFLAKYKWKILAAIVAFFVLKMILQNLKNGNTSTTGTGGTKPPAQPKKTYPCKAVDRNATIYYGLKGSCEVAYVQIWLNAYYAANLTVDGNYGTKTKAALEAAGKPTGGSLNSMAI